jgi:hypothetical protein
MISVTSLALTDWSATADPDQRDRAQRAVESGGVLWLPKLAFAVKASELGLLTPDRPTAEFAKNISLSPDGTRLKGCGPGEAEGLLLRGLMRRFAIAARALVDELLPAYGRKLEAGRTSFRPVEIAGRQTSWRKDDTRLHVDSFPSSPTAGRRILRVFSNVDPQGRPRTWRLGEPFKRVAERFIPGLRPPLWGSHALLHGLGATRSRRTDYDHYMLGLHDRMKADLQFQRDCEQTAHEFDAGSAWLVFTDQAAHAAMRGRCALEQTFLVPVEAMREPQLSPLRILESQLGRRLI